MVFKNLLRRKARTLFTMLGVALGVAAIISLGAMGNGLEQGYSSMMSKSSADLVLSQPDAIEISYSSVDEALERELLAMPEVTEVSGMIEGFLAAEGSPFLFIFGYPEGSFVMNRVPVIEGYSIFDRIPGSLRGKPIMIGNDLASALKKQVGDTLRIATTTYRVVGVYDTGDAFQDSGVILPLDDAQDLLGKPRQVSLFYLKVKDLKQRDQLEARVARRWSDLVLSTTQEYDNKQVFDDYMKGFVWIIAGLAIVLGGVGMMNAQLMAVYERTREIGVLRAVGWSRGRVLGMILAESVLVCLLGGVLGVGLGYLALLLLASNTVMMGASSAAVSMGLLVQALVVMLVLGLAGGLYPAWQAAKLEPIDALRYEGGTSGEHVRRLPIHSMALQNLWQRSTRTLLTITVIALTVGSIMALESYMASFTYSMNQMARGANLEVMVTQRDVADTSTSAIDERIGDRIAAIPGVANISGIIFTAIVLPNNEGFFIIQGYAPSSQAVQRFRIVQGEPLKANHQIIIGKVVAESLNKGVMDTIELSGSRFKIVGIYESGVGWEDIGGVITLRDAQTLVGRPRKVTMYGVKLHDPTQAQEIADQINTMYPDMQASVSGEFAQQLPDMQSSDAMIAGISLLAVMVGGLGVMNTMLMSVLERTREIGVLRALGWRRRSVLGMIMRESLLLAVIGGIGGILVAFVLVFVLSNAPMIGGLVTPTWEVEPFIRAMLMAGVLGLLGGVYPALHATRLQPVEALRYE
ncbi:MAG: ABC transporter permease [Anaerolineae bacterium]|nr:ABC transporter permease [Anaerolineae bacterium]